MAARKDSDMRKIGTSTQLTSVCPNGYILRRFMTKRDRLALQRLRDRVHDDPVFVANRSFKAEVSKRAKAMKPTKIKLSFLD
jgi:hypothetical protein